MTDSRCLVKLTSNETADENMKMKYFRAVQEAELWKQRYYEVTNEKVAQLRNIESSLMVLEAKLQAERRDIEKRLHKQYRTIKEQKRKIAKLTTANQKLLTGMMKLSQNSMISSKSTSDASYQSHAPPNYKSVNRVESQPIMRPSCKSEFSPAHRSVKFEDNLLRHKGNSKTHRSKSLPMNKCVVRHTTTC
uniref:uncharacterized protein LOC104265852 isoform X2 n=1 Tax=Ciona intestinalis TaxID=7719 RepID=UPI000521C917|nr:uncharacterized protein LOC104265852 isoform X2 [Ciona intestinalis]|eukprot:XP_009859135.1 uncharacterized protein LOC104265852 isoform X2 [Ciona intestinalis]